MKKSAVIQYFGGVVPTALALGVKHPAVSQWPDDLPYSVLGRIAYLQPKAWRELMKADIASKTKPDKD